MIFRRHWMVMVMWAGWWVVALSAQETPSETPAPPPTPTPAPTTIEPTTIEPTTTEPASSSSGAASTFPTTPAPATPPDLTGGLGATSGGEPSGSPTSPQGFGLGAPKAPESAPSFTLPGFYGSSATTYTAGQGRLARPRFRYTANLAVGYDDNALQSPTTPLPEQVILVDPGTPDTIEPVFETRFIRGGGGVLIPTQVVVGARIVKGKPPKFQTIPPLGRVGSFIARGTVGLDMQLFSPRSLFTFDASIGADHYFNRPGDKTDYNGSLALSYLHRISPRMQVTAQVSAVYLTQPDFSRPNTPQTVGLGAYINSNAKLDLSYRWTPRFTSVLSFTDNGLFFEEKTQQTGNYNETVFGTELRYLWSPQLTLLGELRYSAVSYPDNPFVDSHSAFILVGGEFRLSQRASGSVRIGNAIRTFDMGGESASTPYAEMNVAYRLATASVINANMRFGFEEPLAPGQERLVWRSSLGFVQVFTSRLNGLLSLNYLHETTTSPGSDEEFTSDTFDGTLRLEYTISKRFSLNASYTYTQRATSVGFIDYYRNRFFFGGQYNF